MEFEFKIEDSKQAMLTNKEGFNIPLMHSCVNWTATNPLCTKSREINPTVHQFSVSRKKQTNTTTKETQRHTPLAGTYQIERLFAISVSRKKTMFVSSLQTGE